VDVASVYKGVQKYLSLLLFKLIVNDVKISCLTQFDPRKLHLHLPCIYELCQEKEYKREEM